MILLILFTFCTTLCHSNNLTIESKPKTEVQQDHKYPALIYKLTVSQLDKENISCLISCPASTPEEKQFNDEVSISGLALFVGNHNSSAENITWDICDKPLQPAMIYNTETKKYEIGYELYYTQDKAKLPNTRYSFYRQVNPNNEIINSTKSPSHIAVEYQDGDKTKFFIADQSTTLIFHWIPELFFTYSGYDKQIRLKNKNVKVPNEELQSKCEDYINSPEIDMKIYRSFRQNPKEISKSALPDIENLKEWNASQSYGVLGLSQIIPLWYFSTYSARLASCSHMNMVPVWKTIAEGQLRKVDLYLQAVFRKLIQHQSGGYNHWILKRIIFGVSGVLTIHPQSSQDPNSTSALFSSPDPRHRQLIPVPKIIYRIVEGGYYDSVYSAVIVIHNDPNNVSNSDRICSPEEEISGWGTIKNDDIRSGLTYVCRYRVNEVVHDKLAIHSDNTYGGPHPLALNDIRYIHSSGRREGIMASSRDLRRFIDIEFYYFIMDGLESVAKINYYIKKLRLNT